jgi:hypothetical protein
MGMNPRRKYQAISNMEVQEEPTNIVLRSIPQEVVDQMTGFPVYVSSLPNGPSVSRPQLLDETCRLRCIILEHALRKEGDDICG